MGTRSAEATTDKDTLVLGAGFVGLLVVGVGGSWVSLHLAAYLTGDSPPVSNPLRLVVELVTGQQPWSIAATWVAAALGVMLLVLVVGAVILWPGKRRMRPDRSARHMANRHDLAHLTGTGAARKAQRLGSWPDGPVGLPLGKTVQGGQPLVSSWEDMVILIAGPRTQKTTAYAIPAVLAAPGACLATSNKRDLVDATTGPRSRLGRVWVFDPQQVANTVQTWWWNPLSFVAGSEMRAEKLAGQFVNSTRTAGARTDAYFDGEAENLIGLLILAAALDDHPVTVVYTWLTRPTSDIPTDILKDHGYELQQQSLYALSHLPDKQREGVYGTARSLMGFLRNRQIAAWVTPHGDEFHPTHFADRADTLYALSREGEGSVGPLVAALTMAVLDALETKATTSPDGRLPVPFVGVLDEAANICKLRNLDLQYSHFGSRGIILFTVLQSWAQGADVWGDRGIEKLWSSANVKIYGGGVDDDKFLKRLSDLIGPVELVVRSQSVNKGSRTVTRAVHERTIMTPAELRELPQGRAVLFASGTPAVLIQPEPWYHGRHATTIQASITANSPQHQHEHEHEGVDDDRHTNDDDDGDSVSDQRPRRWRIRPSDPNREDPTRPGGRRPGRNRSGGRE